MGITNTQMIEYIEEHDWEIVAIKIEKRVDESTSMEIKGPVCSVYSKVVEILSYKDMEDQDE